MRRRSPRIYAVQTAGSGDCVVLADAASTGRVVAMQRRRQLSQGKRALNGAGAPTFTVLRGGAG